MSLTAASLRRARPLELPYKYLRSLGPAISQSAVRRTAETLCIFIGYPRSGHSLVGYLLDAHPDAVIAHELDLVRLIRWRFSTGQIVALTLESAARATARGSRSGGGYTYHVAGQWQGRHRQLKVIGDKKGAATVRHLTERPDLLDRLRQLGPPRLRAIHIVRNPYDNIATMAKGSSVEEAAASYLRLVAGVEEIAGRLNPGELHTIRHEDFVAAPRRSLESLCEFLGLEQDEAYLSAAAGIVRSSPHATRSAVAWPAPIRDAVTEKIDTTPFLMGYGFEG